MNCITLKYILYNEDKLYKFTIIGSGSYQALSACLSQAYDINLLYELVDNNIVEKLVIYILNYLYLTDNKCPLRPKLEKENIHSIILKITENDNIQIRNALIHYSRRDVSKKELKQLLNVLIEYIRGYIKMIY